MSGAVQRGVEHALLDLRHRSGRFGDVDRHAHHFDPAAASSTHCWAVARIGRVGHRHRLHDDRRAAADLDVPDATPTVLWSLTTDMNFHDSIGGCGASEAATIHGHDQDRIFMVRFAMPETLGARVR
jgi:hypothetical protein